MVKKKLTPVVLFCCLLIGLNACTRYVVAGAAVAGAAAGTYFFVKGNLKRNYEAPVERVWEATLQAVEGLKLATESKKHDAFGEEIKGKMTDGDSFQIELKRLGDKSTEVGVRIGVSVTEPNLKQFTIRFTRNYRDNNQGVGLLTF